MNFFPFIKKCILCLAGVLLVSQFVLAQSKTVIIGKVNNAKLIKTIDLSLNKLYLTNEVEIYSAKVLEDNSFAFVVPLDQPQVGILEYSRNKGIIYLEPNDTLHLECDANNFQYSFEFGGGLGESNKCWNEYLKKYPRETNVFNMTQYRQKRYWYQNNPKMDQDMLAMSRVTFENHMKVRHDNSIAILAKYEAREPNLLTASFKKFFKAEVQYDFAYHRLLYGNIFKNRYSIQPDYFEFLEEIPLQNDQIGNEWYREFLIAYFDFKNLKKESGDDRSDFIFQYEEGSNALNGKTQAFFQSEIIARAFRAKENEAIMPKYWDYMRHQDFGSFDQKLVEVYSKAIKFASGTKAPDFALVDINNNVISLDQFAGKVVHLNFWATWCRPCMTKMENLKSIQSELEARGVIFINVSLDRDEEVWRNTLQKKSFNGIHVLASGELNSDIAKAYEISVLPRYFIINKNGDFVKNPKSNNLEKIKTTLLRQVEQ